MFVEKQHILHIKPVWITAIKRMNYFVFSTICRTFAIALIHEMKMKHFMICISIALSLEGLVGGGGRKTIGEILQKKL